MRHHQALAGLALATTLVPLTPSHATQTTVGHGPLCGMSTSGDTTGLVANPGTQVGLLEGGPFTVVNTTSPTTLPNPYVVCSVQVGGTGHFSDPDVAYAEGWQPGFTGYLPPTTISFQAGQTDPVFVCSEIWIFTGDGHLTIYLDDATNTFMTDPQAAACALATSASDLLLDSTTYTALPPVV